MLILVNGLGFIAILLFGGMVWLIQKASLYGIWPLVASLLIIGLMDASLRFWSQREINTTLPRMFLPAHGGAVFFAPVWCWAALLCLAVPIRLLIT